MKDNQYDSDGNVTELGDSFFKKAKPVSAFPEIDAVVNSRGKQKSPTKTPITIRLSPEVDAYFRATGKGWQTRIDEVLKEYVSKQ